MLSLFFNSSDNCFERSRSFRKWIIASETTKALETLGDRFSTSSNSLLCVALSRLTEKRTISDMMHHCGASWCKRKDFKINMLKKALLGSTMLVQQLKSTALIFLVSKPLFLDQKAYKRFPACNTREPSCCEISINHQLQPACKSASYQ